MDLKKINPKELTVAGILARDRIRTKKMILNATLILIIMLSVLGLIVNNAV